MRLPVVAVAVLCAAVSAETIYFEDGTSLNVPAGSGVYIQSGAAWRYTRFDADGMHLERMEPDAKVVEVCEEAEMTFGGSSQECVEVVETPPVECDELTFGAYGC